VLDRAAEVTLEDLRGLVGDLADLGVHGRIAQVGAVGHGTGTPVRGLAQDLLLVLCGRRLPPGRLEGEAATRLSQ
jgi:hypothetical protein